MSWAACNYECLLTSLSSFWKERVQESLEQPSSNRIIRQKKKEKKKEKRPKQNAKQYQTSSVTGLNWARLICTVVLLTAQEPPAWVKGYQEWLDPLSCWDKKQVAKSQSSSWRKHVSTLTDFKGTAHMFNVKDVLKSVAELEPMRFLRSSLPMILGLAEVAC